MLINYIPARLTTGKSWYISYYVLNPATKSLVRKRIKVNRITPISERRKFARQLIHKINVKLAEGWNPFLEQEAPKSYTKLIDALESFLIHKQKELRSRDTIRTYKSHVEILVNYVRDIRKSSDLIVLSFDAIWVRQYMDYLYNERNIGGKTYNNYRTVAVGIWNWMIEHLYCKVNPFLTVRRVQEQKKKRQIIDIETRSRIKEYLLRENKIEYLAMVMICFHGLIRPKEICLLKPENIRLDDKIIFLTADMTKDKDDRIVSISSELMNYLKALKIETISKEDYIFSSNFKPGKKLIDSRNVGREWTKLRNALKFPKEYQFYSLKDSGIVQMLMDGISPIEVRNQAGHSSLEQTNEYAKYANPTGSEQIKTKASDF
jgi:integrase